MDITILVMDIATHLDTGIKQIMRLQMRTMYQYLYINYDSCSTLMEGVNDKKRVWGM